MFTALVRSVNRHVLGDRDCLFVPFFPKVWGKELWKKGTWTGPGGVNYFQLKFGELLVRHCKQRQAGFLRRLERPWHCCFGTQVIFLDTELGRRTRCPPLHTEHSIPLVPWWPSEETAAMDAKDPTRDHVRQRLLSWASISPTWWLLWIWVYDILWDVPLGTPRSI